RHEQSGEDGSLPASRASIAGEGACGPQSLISSRAGAKDGAPAVPHDSRDSEIDIGPMIHQRQLQIVETHVEDAIGRGARLLAGGKRLPELGPNFFAPTILADVDHSMTVMREETFGPVLPVRSFKTADEAIALANDSEFGLAA